MNNLIYTQQEKMLNLKNIRLKRLREKIESVRFFIPKNIANDEKDAMVRSIAASYNLN